MNKKMRMKATRTNAKLAAIEVVLKNHLSPLLSGPADNLRLTGAGLVREDSLIRPVCLKSLTGSYSVG